MARKATTNIAFTELKKICKEKGINSWPEYQKRYTEIPGAKKTLHATYKGQWKGNKAFFGDASTIEKKADAAPVVKKTETKKVAPKKTASNSSKKAGKAAKKPAAKKAVKETAAAK